jgi:hypothetical protein
MTQAVRVDKGADVVKDIQAAVHVAKAREWGTRDTIFIA